MNAIRLPSGDHDARSPKCDSLTMPRGRGSSGLPGRVPCEVPHATAIVSATAREVRMARIAQDLGTTVNSRSRSPLAPAAGSGIRDQGSGIRDQGSGIRDQGSGIRDSGLGTRDSGSGKREAGSGKQEAGSGKQEAGSWDRLGIRTAGPTLLRVLRSSST
jgi:hypothetical protein